MNSDRKREKEKRYVEREIDGAIDEGRKKERERKRVERQSLCSIESDKRRKYSELYEL
jgi:hypothetical protein